MKLKYWLRPGIGIKRWIGQMLFGIFIFIYGILEIINRNSLGSKYILFFIGIITIGVVITYNGFKGYTKKMLSLGSLDVDSLSFNKKSLGELIYEKKILVKGPKIVVIGGGTGLSTLLSGLKRYTSNITAIVTVADDGGGSGLLRKDLGMLPPGDIRNCITALAYTEPIMEELFQYRFKDGRLENQNFGNLFLAAMDGISDNFHEAVKKTCSVLAVTGRVIPVTLENITLSARLKNEFIIKGESNIPKQCMKFKSGIDEVYIEPRGAKAVQDAIDAILEADAVVLGPGSLYTSIIPNLLVGGIKDAILKTKAIKIYISNILTQPGESDNYSVQDHISAIYKHSSKDIVDYVIVNNEALSEEDKQKCLNKNPQLVMLDEEYNSDLGVEYIKSNFIKLKNGYIKHDEDKLAAILVETVMRKKLFYDEKRILEFFYLSQMLKEFREDREKN